VHRLRRAERASEQEQAQRVAERPTDGEQPRTMPVGSYIGFSIGSSGESGRNVRRWSQIVSLQDTKALQYVSR